MRGVFTYTTAGGFLFSGAPHALTLPINTCNTQLATTEFVDYLRGFYISSTSSGALSLNDRNALVRATADITIPANVFTLSNPLNSSERFTHDKVVIFNQLSSPISLIAGSSM